jgi:hypothetical protein
MSSEVEFEKMMPEEYLKFMDALFLVQKKRILNHSGFGKPEPFDMEYMETSARMKRVLRQQGQGGFLPGIGEDVSKVEEAMALSQKYIWAYAYWWNRTHALEAMAKTRVGGIKVKKDIEKGADTLRRLVSGEKLESDLHPQFKKLIQNLATLKLEKPGAVSIPKED